MLWKALGQPTPEGKCPFTDVSEGAWYYEAVTALYEAGIVCGIGNNLFAPTDTLSREMGFTMLAHAFNLTPANPSDCDKFSDANEISSWAREFTSALTERGYVVGIGNNLCAPQQAITRGEIATLLLHIADGEKAASELEILFQNACDFDPTTDTNDGIYIASITDQYFEGGVEAGLEALLQAGQVYVNGIQIPATAAEYNMNGMPAIWQKENGDWTWQAHDKLNSDSSSIPGNTDSNTFEFARRRFVIAVSALRGMTTTIWMEAGETVACRVDFSIKSGAQVEKIVVNNDNTTTVWGVPIDATSYNTDGGPNDVQPRTLPTANFDQNIQVGDTVLYWYDTDGWNMERAIPVQGIMTATNHFDINVGGTKYSDALIVRYNMQAGSRPSQVISEINNLALAGIPVTLWNTDTGYVIGISHMEYAGDALEAAIAYVDAQLAGKTIVASTDGSDVPVGTYWVTQAILDTYNSAYANAKAVLANPDSTNAQKDAATEALSSAFGNSASRGMRTAKEGTLEPALVLEIVTRMYENSSANSVTNAAAEALYGAKFEEGSVADGLKAIIANGTFYVDGVAVPANETEFDATYGTDGYYTINNADRLYRSGSQWMGGTTSYDSYLDAAYTAVGGLLSNGLTLALYDTDGDGYPDRAETWIWMGSMIVANLTNNGDGTYTLDRGDFVTVDPLGGKLFDGAQFLAGDTSYTLKAENVDSALQVGDIALFYAGPSGEWAVVRPVEVNGILVDGSDHNYYQMDSVQYADVMQFKRDNIIISNRPGEFVNAFKYFGFLNNDENLNTSLWLVPTVDPAKPGGPIGFTANENASIFLEKAIAIAQAKLNAVVVSADGTDVPVGDKWVTQSVYDSLDNAIATAQGILDNDSRTAIYQYQVYRLYLMLHGVADDIGARFGGFTADNFINFDAKVQEGTMDDITPLP